MTVQEMISLSGSNTLLSVGWHRKEITQPGPAQKHRESDHMLRAYRHFFLMICKKASTVVTVFLCHLSLDIVASVAPVFKSTEVTSVL